ncbi:MAG: GAF and ANTAR domain-containing protein [Mycobacterium sp.]|uniref:ANTAR domain-containing response regulator n=1 Tax=Mycobacterium sp. TaxID=1785 RepID=UPI003CC608EE
MSQERPDELCRLVSTSEAIASLHALFDAEEPLDTVLVRVAQTANRAVHDADAVSITVLGDPESRTVACTDERMLSLDQVQYSSGRGPCLEAAERRTPVRIAMDIDAQRWPEFVAASRDAGVLATLSVPLIVALTGQDNAGELVGSLNIYSRRVPAFDSFDEELLQLFATTASQAITNARRWQQSRDSVAALQRALVSRTDIDQAKGVLRDRTGCSADEAFAMLVEQSQRANIKLHTVAVQLLQPLSNNR